MESNNYRRSHTARGKARPGSARWFRRYRWLVIAGWLIALLVVLWVLFFRVDKPSNGLPTMSLGSEPSAGAAGGNLAPVKLPADDAVHEQLTEWWYYSGHLQTEAGERYSFHMAAFVRRGTLTHTVFHGSLLDHQNEKLYAEQARTAGVPADMRRDGFAFSYGDWQLRGSGEQHAAKMAGKDFRLEVQLTDRLPPVLHQVPGTPVAGLLDFGAAGKSYYTSRPRMSAQGTLSIGGTAKAVRGEVWFDHQWGDFEAAKLRWNWFALQLADGADLMIFELFDRQGGPVLRMGTYAKEGKAEGLASSDFATNARGSWKSPSTGTVYPMDWTISIPAKGLSLKVDPVIRWSQFNALTTTMNVYWEGAVKVSGSHTGVGFMELSGYQSTRETDPGKPRT
ncbi:MAG: lipocalin family protein [Candidatus Accumulibacter sp.]|uniref:lipocalin family protein n=1 Tax=Accumulibacter sp. TaxID=2053492 RepID=UPI00287A2C2A|nr:lipocalin family protein [Accumulibacter sp.]MDS4013300.1 lipocalin family protein [Accumulibacter sp.]